MSLAHPSLEQARMNFKQMSDGKGMKGTELMARFLVLQC